MYNQCYALLETGSSHDLIKLYDMHQERGAEWKPGEVIDNFKKYIAQEIDLGLSLNEITKLLNIYEKDKEFCHFILSKAIEHLQSGSKVRAFDLFRILLKALDIKD